MDSMAKVMVRCVDNRALQWEGPDGVWRYGPADGETLLSLTIGKLYEVLWEDENFYRILDNMGDSAMYPKDMFEKVS